MPLQNIGGQMGLGILSALDFVPCFGRKLLVRQRYQKTPAPRKGSSKYDKHDHELRGGISYPPLSEEQEEEQE